MSDWTASSALQARRPIDIPEYQADEPSFDADTLAHHGIKGQKWGIRRFQNTDGSLTAAGKQRYGTADGSGNKSASGTDRKANMVTSSSASTKINQPLSESERKLKISNERAYYKNLEKETDTRNIKDKKAKETLEGQILDGWTKPIADRSYEKQIDLSIALHQRIRKEAGSWYDGTAVSKDFGDALKTYKAAKKNADRIHEKISNQIAKQDIEKLHQSRLWRFKSKTDKEWAERHATFDAREKARQDPAYKKAKESILESKSEICGAALRSIGYEDTPRNREKIYELVYDD